MYEKVLEERKRNQRSPLQDLGIERIEVKEQIDANVKELRHDKMQKYTEDKNWGSLEQYIDIKKTLSNSIDFAETPDDDELVYKNQPESAREHYKIYGKNRILDKSNRKIYGPQPPNFVSIDQMENLKTNIENSVDKGISKNVKMEYNRAMIKKYANNVITTFAQNTPDHQTIFKMAMSKPQSDQVIPNQQSLSFKNKAIRS